MLIKHDNVIETRIKEMHGPSTTNPYLSNPELLPPFTFLFLDEASKHCPLKKMNKKVINYLIS
jgi:hypothetical protein